MAYLQAYAPGLKDLGYAVRIVLVLTKTDLNPDYDKAAILGQVKQAKIPISSDAENDVFATSAKTGEGVDDFLAYLERNFVDPAASASARGAAPAAEMTAAGNVESAESR